MQTQRLIEHPAFRPSAVERISVRWGRMGNNSLMLRFRFEGCRDLIIPTMAGRGRGDELWRTTCCELFLARKDGRYREFNFSPSGQWAVYDFAGYRNRIGNGEPCAKPVINIEKHGASLTVTAYLDREELKDVVFASLSAVVEEKGQHMSYWAVRHASDKPDFHNPACFVLPVT